MNDAYICDGIRTPFGRYAGILASIRTDDLGAIPLESIVQRNPAVDWEAVDDVVLGCANQAGEDNRNVARMCTLLAGLPESIPGTTVNRLCGSGMDAVGIASRAIKSGETQLMIAGGVESMSRAPFVIPKAETGFSRSQTVYDTTMGWRFINERLKSVYGVDSMLETAENVAEECAIGRDDQDRFALNSQLKTARARERNFFDQETVPVSISSKSRNPVVVTQDEHPRDTSPEKLAALAPVVRPGGTVTAGNSSGVNDGACALLLANEHAIGKYALTPRARVLGMTSTGLAPRVMGLGPVPATRKLIEKINIDLNDFDVIELNEAFAAQALAVLRELKISDEDERVNPNGGAISLGHPLGASGARLIVTAINQLHAIDGRFALCTMCVGVGQGVAIALERIS